MKLTGKKKLMPKKCEWELRVLLEELITWPKSHETQQSRKRTTLPLNQDGIEP